MGLVKLADETYIFYSEIPFGNFGLPLKISVFPRKFPFEDDEQSFVSRSNYHILNFKWLVFEKVESLSSNSFLPCLPAANASAKQANVDHSGKLSVCKERGS